jgi:hypothetical protein
MRLQELDQNAEECGDNRGNYESLRRGALLVVGGDIWGRSSQQSTSHLTSTVGGIPREWIRKMYFESYAIVWY